MSKNIELGFAILHVIPHIFLQTKKKIRAQKNGGEDKKPPFIQTRNSACSASNNYGLADTETYMI